MSGFVPCPRCAAPKKVDSQVCLACRREEDRRQWIMRRVCVDCGGLRDRDAERCVKCMRTYLRMLGDWTPERIYELKERLALGETAKQIAFAMGVTKGAVMGKKHRLGLCMPKDAKRPGRPQEPWPYDLILPNDCRWPIGHPGSEGFSFCGEPADGGPYCAMHHKLGYIASHHKGAAD